MVRVHQFSSKVEVCVGVLDAITLPRSIFTHRSIIRTHFICHPIYTHTHCASNSFGFRRATTTTSLTLYDAAMMRKAAATSAQQERSIIYDI